MSAVCSSTESAEAWIDTMNSLQCAQRTDLVARSRHLSREIV